MLISFPQKLKLCSDPQETCFLRNVFEAVQKTRSTSFIGSKTTRLRLAVLNPIKHSCSFFKNYVIGCANMCVEWIIMNPGACMVIYDRTHSKLLQFANLHLNVMVKSVCL